MKAMALLVFCSIYFYSAMPMLSLNNIHSACALQQKEHGIRWDSSTLIRISPQGASGSYPRMIQLKSGTLLTAYASHGNIVITKSNDEGKTWAPPKVAAAMRDAVNMDTPELLQLQNGAVLLCHPSASRLAPPTRFNKTL